MLATPTLSSATVHLAGATNRSVTSSSNDPFLYKTIPVLPRCSQGLIRPALNRSQGMRDPDQHPDLRKTRMCPSVTSSAKCPYSAEECRFAHSQSELRVSFDRFYKVQPCAFYDRGKCRNGDLCRFAHGNRELRNGVAPNCIPSSRRNGAASATFSNSPRMVRQESLGDGLNSTSRRSEFTYIPTPNRHSDSSEDANYDTCAGRQQQGYQQQTPRAEDTNWPAESSLSPSCKPTAEPQRESKGDAVSNRDDMSPSTCPGDEDIASDESLSSTRSLSGIDDSKTGLRPKCAVWLGVSHVSESTVAETCEGRHSSDDSVSLNSGDKPVDGVDVDAKAIVRQCSSLAFADLRRGLLESVTFSYED